jgi:LPS sulfotransferase NodH
MAVTWKGSINAALVRATGYQLRKADARDALPRGDRLVRRPAFIMCTLRSGSTLLRVLLNSHSQLHAPHELHLRYVNVKLAATWSKRSMKEMGLDADALRYLLWDRILHRELAASGKRYVVDKTPNNVFIADRIMECWPDARFVYLLRHPAAIARSRLKVRPNAHPERNVDLIRRYCEALERARQAHPGVTVRYEDLTTDPAAVTRRVCEFLDVPWEAEMLAYGRFEHGRYRAGLGDWADKIRSGRVQAAEPPPEEIPELLRDASAAWGYLPQATRVSAD